MQGQLPDREQYLLSLLHEMLKPWPQNRTINIVCHGHSVPAGYFCTPIVNPLHAYPHLLFVGVKERFAYAVINVIVTAIGGENAEAGAARFAAEVLTHRPDVVTIDYALNDRGIGLERAERAWRAMIEQALAHVEREIAARSAIGALLAQILGEAVFPGPVADDLVEVDAPGAAGDETPPVARRHDQPSFRTFSVISLSAARSRNGLIRLLARLA